MTSKSRLREVVQGAYEALGERFMELDGHITMGTDREGRVTAEGLGPMIQHLLGLAISTKGISVVNHQLLLSLIESANLEDEETTDLLERLEKRLSEIYKKVDEALMEMRAARGKTVAQPPKPGLILPK